MKEIKGIIAPMATPFTADGELDIDKARKEAELLIKAGVDGISPGGSTGEGAMLSDEEIGALVKMLRELSSDLIIVAGIIRNSTQAALSAAEIAKKNGADALMVTPVSYTALVPDDVGNYSYYNTISDKIGLPIVYNVVPQNPISAELFNKISEIKNVYGIKQSIGGVMSFYEMKIINGEKAKIFAASDEMMYTTFHLKADGAISAIITAFPELCVRMWNDAKIGNDEDGMEIQRKLYKVWRTIAGSQFPIRLKYALNLLGRDVGFTRSPICHLSEKDKSQIYDALKENGFI